MGGGLALLLALGAAAPAGARPLFDRGQACRDMKGLSKPCAPGEAPKRMARPVPESAAGAGAQASSGPAGAPARRPGRRPLFQSGPLCRDSKGLAKPC